MGVGPRYDGGAGSAGGGGRDFGGGRGGGPGDDAEALLRARLRLADEQIETPPGLWGRVRDPGATPAPAVAALPRRRPYAVALVVAAAVAAVVLSVWWLVRPGPVALRPAGPPATVKVTVYNSERACRTGRSLECALRLARDPRAEYAARGNSAGRVWHGDGLAAHCVVTDGRMVRDEAGVTSTRWYLVTTGQGVRGWLPGVRTRNTREVRECPGGER
ncbi:hypothetical protein AB0G60_24040 [Streptomyces angustmyceticus]|uniref:Uncharacterized protein n=1 Tax=Streptomyces angustmyceticus TaxID=285578 RepID=A0A5J4LUF4_9ACTN|nr:hypothetical protein [Streptomyces angustmyceticus]GES33928.1 hypothetical protein San01_64160 [Streptomyces angustmyceticus]